MTSKGQEQFININKRDASPRSLRRLVSTFFTVVCTWLVLSCPASAQNVQFTQGGVGSGLENTIQIPITAHPGRGSASLPVNLYYSSQVWRIGFNKTVNGTEPTTSPATARRAVAEAIYAEYSNAGWTTSLDPPKIEWPQANDRYTYDGKPYNGTVVENYQVQHLFVHLPDGSVHELRKRDEVNVYNQNDIYYHAVDGSRLRYQDIPNTNSGTLWMPDGSRYEFQFGYQTVQFIDRNGNKLTYDGTTRIWKDTLGRDIAQPWPANPQPGVDYTYTPEGYLSSYHFKWDWLGNVLTPGTPALRAAANYYLSDPNQAPTDQSGGNYPTLQPTGTDTLFASLPEEDDFDVNRINLTYLVARGQTGATVFNPIVLSEVVLPNGLSYKFTYNEYGEVDKVVYPTGGYDKYTYGGAGHLGYSKQPYTQSNRGVNLRQQSAAGDGNITATWRYEGGGSYVKTTMPDGAVNLSYRYNFFNVLSRNFGYEDARNGMTYDEQVWDKDPSLSGAKMMRRTLTDWTQTIKNLSLTAATLPHPTTNYKAYRNARPSKSVSFIFDTGGPALAKLVTYGYDTNNGYKELTTGFDRTLMTESYYASVDQSTATATITDIEHPLASYPDYLFSSAGSAVTTYQNGQSYRDRYILGLKTSITLNDSAGQPVAKTETEYDQQTLVYYNDLGADPYYQDPGAGAVRGNPTTTRRYVDLTLGTSLETRAQFDQYGNPINFWDERNTQSQQEYSPDYRHAYLTKTTSAVPDSSGAHGANTAFVSLSAYDYATGLLVSMTDSNNQVTTTNYSDDSGVRDPLNRVRKVTRPDGSWTKTDYNDVLGNLYAHTETQVDAGRSTHSYQFFDGLGRSSRTLARELGLNYVMTENHYDNMGRANESSNPIRTTVSGTGNPTQAPYWETASAPTLWTTTEYDKLGRVSKVTLPDDTYMTTEYEGVYTTVTDQAGRQRRQKADALGHIIRIDEPGADGSLGGEDSPAQPSFYEYDTLGNVIRVNQGLTQAGANPEDAGNYTQHRYFKYDAISRLTHEKHAEQAGTISAADPLTGNQSWSRKLTYDETVLDENANPVSYKGLLTTAEDARHVVSSYLYDQLGRIYQLSYSDGTPTVKSKYDQAGTDAPPSGESAVTFKNKGRLTEVTTTVGGTTQTQQLYDYDIMGRTRRHRQVVGGNTYELRYAYNLGGSLTSERYPSGRVVNYSYDDTGRPSGAGSGATTYASSMSYTPFGGLESMTLGNGAIYAMAYDGARLQLASITLTQGANTLQKYEYKYGRVNMATGSVDASKNDGRIARIESTVGTQKLWQQRFAYDNLGQLTETGEYRGDTGQQSYYLKYDYDVFGNRFQRLLDNPRDQNNQPTNPFLQSFVENGAYNVTTNRLTSGVTYDDAGNITRDERFRMLKFAYDANNRQRQSSSLLDTNVVQSVYDGMGRRVATKVDGNITRVMIYDAFGMLAAEYGQEVFQNGTQYVMADNQGSTRVTMYGAPAGGQLVAARQDYLPFGGELSGAVGMRSGVAGYGQPTGPRQKYAGMERDEATGMSHTLWRKYDDLSARWTSPDPYVGSMELSKPQSFNRYTYCDNDPVNRVDPAGLMPFRGAEYGWNRAGWTFADTHPYGGGGMRVSGHIFSGLMRHLGLRKGFDIGFGRFVGEVQITVKYPRTSGVVGVTYNLYRPTGEQVIGILERELANVKAIYTEQVNAARRANAEQALGAANLLDKINKTPTREGFTFTTKRGQETNILDILDNSKLFNKGKLYGKHIEDAKCDTGGCADYRSPIPLFGDTSLQVVYNATLKIGWADTDAHNPYQFPLGTFGHLYDLIHKSEPAVAAPIRMMRDQMIGLMSLSIR